MIKILFIGNKLTRHGFTPGVIDTLGPLLETEGYEVTYAGTFKNKFLRLAEILWKTIIYGRKADYILIDTYSTQSFWYAHLTGRLANLLDKRYIHILRGGNLPERLKKSKRACNRIFLNSYANVAVSDYLRYEFEKAGYPAIVIPNFIDISKYPFKLREHPRPRLLWVRSFHKIYNPNMAAEVLKELLKVYPDAELCMVGPDKDGSMQEFKEYAKTLGISKHITITGLLKKEEWVRLSEEYDIFINTTNYDNTPISVVEAMALGMCIVTTNPGGIKYLCEAGNDALLVDPGDSLSMVEKIINIIEKPEFGHKLSRNALLKAENFAWDKIKDKWLNLLSQ